MPEASYQDTLIRTIREGIIGDDETLEGPFGVRRITYADYTASGRSLSFIEEYLRQEVMPKYANTHTEISGTGLQTTTFREEARAIIREAVGATDEHAVIFCGSGATAAVNKLIGILDLRIPAGLDERYDLCDCIPCDERPVVFVGPYEHHSNELPWKESIAEVVLIGEDGNGDIDRAQLERELERTTTRTMRIGAFSAASNVTGIISDVSGISRLLHEHGALAFWDYAAAGPYLDIRMEDGAASKDAIFLSPHKFIGGPGTPGILIVRRDLCKNTVPVEPGGGTVLWVTPTDHAYLTDVEHREEGGTPNIIGSIRAGLAFQLKQAVGVELIREREEEFVRRSIETWSNNENIVVLGNPSHERISIVSMLFAHGDSYLHWGFVASLLNDLFGIQARGGCSCAGPYGHTLLDIDMKTSRAMAEVINHGFEGMRPGWVRLNFNYFISHAACDFLVHAIDFIGTYGWQFVPLYEFCPSAGRWTHRDGYPGAPMHLRDISYVGGRMAYDSNHTRLSEDVFEGYLEQAESIRCAWLEEAQSESLETPELDPDFERWRWFPLPHEILPELQGADRCCQGQIPLAPSRA